MDKQQDLTLWQVSLSILASFFGVQNSRNQARDFKHGKLSQFVIVGFVMAALWYCCIALIVSWVLPD